MLDSYPRSDGSQCPSNHNNIKGCWIPIQGPVDPVSIHLQNYKEDVRFLSKVRWIQCPSIYKITKRMLDSYPRSGGSSVHPFTKLQRGCWIPIQGPVDPVSIHLQNYKEDVGFLSKVRWIQCPSKYRI